MKPRLVILTEIIAPYRIPLFNALADIQEVELHVIFLAETDPQLRQWQTYKEEIRFAYEILPSWRRRIGKHTVLLNRGLNEALVKQSPDAILCGGYNYVASWQALRWARRRKVPFFLWSESNTQDARGDHALVELLKKRFIVQCSGFVVPGKSAHAYLRSLNVDQRMIFVAPNAVDNEFYANASRAARLDPASNRRKFGLPEHYFLFAGRLVRDKGVFELLSAYARLDESVRRQFALVLVGDGEERRRLEQLAAAISPGTVRIAGFAQRDELAIYYALADMLILPTYTDPWGLVVNEAMACGLPIILSHAAGCAADLLEENCNGMLIPPKDIPSLAFAMHRLACQPDLRVQMAMYSARHIARFSPQQWAAGIVRILADRENPHV